MSENNKSYRIRTNVGETNTNGDYINIDVNLLQDYDLFEILSLKIGTENLYKYHTSKYGCIVGRVLANGGVGVPNAKISVFIKVENDDLKDPIISYLYPYTSTTTKNNDNIRYNTLTDQKINDCHQNVGTFPNKRLVLDDDNVIEVYDKYYKYTTSTNGSGDYMIFGVPVGNNILHTDIDLSDIGILSQKPRDLFYKGYTQTQFENSSMFKSSSDLDNLSQIISQDSSVYVYPFWGDEDENKEQIKITRNDIEVNYKFEPTCIFIGSIVSDEKSNAISKNCIPHERMGKMDRLTTGKGTIEMIRKTVGGNVESKIIQGNELIDGNGTWCYQIPMNLDYVATDEFGNLVPTDNYEKGIPTRTSVRFRISLADYESDHENAHLVKVLVPNNPQLNSNGKIEFDYQFGSQTSDDSFKDLFWNNVYTVKQFIPRFQKGNRQRNKNFTGFKAVNVNGSNNPIPYNNMRINLTFLFVFQCLIFKSVVQIIKFFNKLIYILNKFNSSSSKHIFGFKEGLAYVTLDAGMCPALEGNYMALGAKNENSKNIIKHTYDTIIGNEFNITFTDKETKDDEEKDDSESETSNFQSSNGSITVSDSKSSDGKNGVLSNNDKIDENITVEKPDGNTLVEKEETVKIYNQEDYFVKCVELNFAMEYEVIQFDFYNDWINGMIYIPRWFAEVKMNKDKVYYCGETFDKYRYLTQQCALGFDENGQVSSNFDTGCKNNSKKQECHKLSGRKQVRIFGGDKGIVKKHTDSKGKNIYYLRPSETISYNGSTGRNNEKPFKVNLFSTDIMLLGSVSDCNIYGLPKVNGYTSSTYRMPPPTAEIVSDTQEIGFDSSLGLLYQDFYNNKILPILDGIIEDYMSAYFKYKAGNVIYIMPLKNYFNFKGQNIPNIRLDNIKIKSYNPVNEDTIKSVCDDVYSDITTIFKTISTAVTFDSDAKHYFSKNGCVGKHVNSESYSPNYALKRYLGIDKDGNIDENCLFNNDSNFKRCKCLETSDGTSYYGTPLITKIKTALYENFTLDNFNNYTEGKDYDKYFYKFTKAPASSLDTFDYDNPKEGEVPNVFSEISGIDWGYNPFTTGDDDDTTLIKNQIAGHFLEIGCTFSLSNIKSCVNLQRICELGSSMSQNHYIYNDSNGNYDILSPTGIINKREIVDSGMRSTFATLNSKKLKTKTDNVNNFKKYIFTPYIPNQFMGDLENKIGDSEGENSFAVLKEYTDDNKYGLIEGQSKSYKLFRFGTTQIRDKFLYVNDNVYYMPQYENSFYFYFGLKDGNTAIDRLYSEYYAECPKVEKKTRVYLFADDFKNNECTIRYNIINFDKVTEIQVICDGVILEYSDTKKEYKINDDGGITVYKTGTYIINFYNYSNKFVSGVITIIDKNAPILDMFCIVSSRNVKNKARFQLSYRNLDVKGDRVYVKINKRYEKLNKNTDYEIDFDKKQLTVFMGDDKTIKPNKSVSKVELTIKLELINDYDKIFSVAKKGIFYS